MANRVHPGSGKYIQGWQWDKTFFPTKRAMAAYEHAPDIFDADLSDLSETYFQSGIGSGDDLLFLDIKKEFNNSGIEIWSPQIMPGYFFIYEDEYYLYSDYHQTDIIRHDAVSGLYQYVELSYDYYPGDPIRVEQYEFDRATQVFEQSITFRRKLSFTSSGQYHYTVDTTGTNPVVLIDGIYTSEIGGTYTTTSGLLNTGSVSDWEYINYSTGESDQQYYLRYSPVDDNETFEIVTYGSTGAFIDWTPIPLYQDFSSVSGIYEVKVDYDEGLILFGTTTSGNIPIIGHKIIAHYTPGIAVKYEPVHKKPIIFANSADLHPFQSMSHQGFIQISNKGSIPSSITLSASTDDFSQISSSVFRTYMGNNFGELIATVYDINDSIVEGIDVYFELISPIIGSFSSGDESISSTTNKNGRASAFYTSPVSLDDMGYASNAPQYPGYGTYFDAQNLVDPGTVSGIYIYKIWDNDPAQGILDSTLDSYYADYLVDEGYVSGATASVDWEKNYRGINNIDLIETYTSTEISKGKKTILLTSGRSDSIDTHSGVYDNTIFVPLYPTSISTISTDPQEIRVTYSGTFLDGIGTDNTKGYLIVGDSYTTARAYVINPITGTKIYSNELTIQVQISNEANGTYYVNSLNDTNLQLTAARNIALYNNTIINQTSGLFTLWEDYIFDGLSGESYADWFRRTQVGNSRTLALIDEAISGLDLGLELISLQDAPGEVPLGFQLYDGSITLASLLDSVTWLDPNEHLPSGLFDLSGYYAEL